MHTPADILSVWSINETVASLTEAHMSLGSALQQSYDTHSVV